MLKHASIIAISLLASSAMDKAIASNPVAEDKAEVNSQRYNIATSQNMPLKFEGLGDAEGSARWTVAQSVVFTGPVVFEGLRIQKVTFHDVVAFASDEKPQTLDVFLNDKQVGKQIKFTSREQKEEVSVDFPADLKGDAAIRFAIPNSAAPSAEDPRLLGLSISDYSVTVKKEGASTPTKSGGYVCNIL
jgi:hypothetical protein